MEHVRVNAGGRAAACLVQRGAGPSLVLLHGAGGNPGSFDELLPHLYGLDVLVPALPGRSGSDGPPLRRIDAAAGWVRSLAEGLAPGPIVVVGHSLGGAAGLELAVAGWPRLTGLVLVSTAARLRVDGVLREIIGDPPAAGSGSPERGVPGGRPPWPPRYPALWRPDTAPALVARAEARLAETPFGPALCDWEMADGFDRSPDLGRIAVPAVVVCGEEDRATPPERSRELARGIPGARLEVISGGGHMLPVERPAELAGILRSFVREL